MAATMTAATMKPCVPTAMIPATMTVNFYVAVRCTTIHCPAVPIPGPVNRAWVCVVWTPVIARPPVDRAPVRVIPRTHADEYAVHEVAGSPVAVRRARVRVICVVTIGADRLNSDGQRAGSNRDSHPDLCRCTRCCQKQNSQQSCIFYVFHGPTSLHSSSPSSYTP